MRPPFKLPVSALVAALFVLAGLDAGASDAGAAGGAASRTTTSTTDTVKVFVGWGSSNACGYTDQR
jgi:hypothetical protein